MQTLAQNFQIINYVVPATRSSAASLSKSAMAFVSMKGYNKVTFVVTCGAMTEASTIIKAYQAKNVTGSSVSSTALALPHFWTNRASVSAATLVRTTATSSQMVLTSVNNAVYMFEVDSGKLNANSGFDCIGLGISGISAATCFSIKAVLSEPRYSADAMPIAATAN